MKLKKPMRILYINPIKKHITLSCVEWSLLLREVHLTIWNDFDTFPEILLEMMDSEKPEQIWCIVWPWPFTRMRIVTLTLSTLVLSLWIKVKWCHFFELIEDGIPLLQANREEYITRSGSGEIVLMHKDQLRHGTYIWYGEKIDFTEDKNYIEYREDWREIETVFTQLPTISVLVPIYLKEPHITWSKKNTSHSWETMKK